MRRNDKAVLWAVIITVVIGISTVAVVAITQRTSTAVRSEKPTPAMIYDENTAWAIANNLSGGAPSKPWPFNPNSIVSEPTQTEWKIDYPDPKEPVCVLLGKSQSPGWRGDHLPEQMSALQVEFNDSIKPELGDPETTDQITVSLFREMDQVVLPKLGEIPEDGDDGFAYVSEESQIKWLVLDGGNRYAFRVDVQVGLTWSRVNLYVIFVPEGHTLDGVSSAGFRL